MGTAMNDNIKSITTEYIAADDRIRVSALLEDNRTVVLWLTQRLLGKLIGELVTRLPHEPAARVPVSGQGAAPTQAVKADDAAVTVLIDVIDLSIRPHETSLTFKAGTDFCTALHLSELARRQWLQILYRLYAKAGWPLDIWPDGMRSSLASEAGLQSITLH